MLFRRRAARSGFSEGHPFRTFHHDDSRGDPTRPKELDAGPIGIRSPSAIVQVRLQLVEFGVKEETIDRAMEKIGSSEELGRVALRNLHLMYQTLLDEDVGQYISQRPHYITMQTAMLARCMEVHPDDLCMGIPEHGFGRILKRREVEPLPVINEQESRRRRMSDELERGLCASGVDAGTAYRFASELREGEYDAEAAARNIAEALKKMPREQVLELLAGNKKLLSPLTEVELSFCIDAHRYGELAKHLDAELAGLATGWNKLVTVARICNNEQGVARLMRKIEALRTEAKSCGIDDERFSKFVNDNIVAIAFENDRKRLSGLLHHRATALQNGSRKQWALDKLKHAKECRTRGMDGKDLCRVLDGTGFKVVSSRRGGSHHRVEYDGEQVKTADGRPVVMLVKTGDLAYGSVSEILDHLIEFLEGKLQQNGK